VVPPFAGGNKLGRFPEAAAGDDVRFLKVKAPGSSALGRDRARLNVRAGCFSPVEGAPGKFQAHCPWRPLGPASPPPTPPLKRWSRGRGSEGELGNRPAVGPDPSSSRRAPGKQMKHVSGWACNIGRGGFQKLGPPHPSSGPRGLGCQVYGLFGRTGPAGGNLAVPIPGSWRGPSSGEAHGVSELGSEVGIEGHRAWISGRAEPEPPSAVATGRNPQGNEFR